MSPIQNNKNLIAEINRIAEVTGYLWTKGWAEANGGNITVNISELMTNEEKNLPPLCPSTKLPAEMTAIANHVFYVTGTVKRMRDISRAPFENGAIIRISNDGMSYAIIAEKVVKPTSELSSHLMMHNYLVGLGRNNKVVLHTHPTELIGMTHCEPFLNSETISRTLWSMIPESRIIIPKGLGIVPYEIPGTIELAKATIKQLEKHDVVFWEKHGILAVGEDIVQCFDVIDTLNKSAQIYISARMFGYKPMGMTDAQLDGLVPAFGLEKYS